MCHGLNRTEMFQLPASLSQHKSGELVVMPECIKPCTEFFNAADATVSNNTINHLTSWKIIQKHQPNVWYLMTVVLLTLVELLLVQPQMHQSFYDVPAKIHEKQVQQHTTRNYKVSHKKCTAHDSRRSKNWTCF